MTAAQKRWSTPLDDQLAELFRDGLSDAQIGARMGGRSVHAISIRRVSLGLLRGPEKIPNIHPASNAMSEHWATYLAAQDDAFDVALTRAGIRFRDVVVR
jgi:hypothetical protein